MKLVDLSDEELRTISAHRYKNGKYTKDALRAQQILNNRSGYSWGKRKNTPKDNWDGALDNIIRAYEDCL